VARLVLQAILVVAGTALRVLLRANCWNGETEEEYGG
jgi:hypothetical protein